MKLSTNNLLKCEIILSVKYGKKLLLHFGEEIKKLILECQTDKFKIIQLIIESDHVRMVIEYLPVETVINVMKRIKEHTTNQIWKQHESDLKYQFWKKKMFWSDTFYVNSVGEINENNIKKYIVAEGKIKMMNSRV